MYCGGIRYLEATRTLRRIGLYACLRPGAAADHCVELLSVKIAAHYTQGVEDTATRTGQRRLHSRLGSVVDCGRCPAQGLPIIQPGSFPDQAVAAAQHGQAAQQHDKSKRQKHSSNCLIEAGGQRKAAASCEGQVLKVWILHSVCRQLVSAEPLSLSGAQQQCSRSIAIQLVGPPAGL